MNEFTHFSLTELYRSQFSNIAQSSQTSPLPLFDVCCQNWAHWYSIARSHSLSLIAHASANGDQLLICEMVGGEVHRQRTVGMAEAQRELANELQRLQGVLAAGFIQPVRGSSGADGAFAIAYM